MIRKSRIITISLPLIVVLLALVIYQYGFLRIQSEMQSLQETSDVKMKILEKYIVMISQKPQLEKRVEALKEVRKAGDSYLVEGQIPTLAAATLQNIVKGIVTSRGGTISSERIEKPETIGKFTLISVSIDSVMPDIHVLNDTLFSIETQTPYLVVKELDARVRNFKEPRELLIKLKVAALTGGR
jgi:hypothetical protein